MGLSRRAKNLIVDVPFQGAKWLRCVDLAGQLFGNTATPPPPTTIAHGSESAAVQEDYTSQTLVSDSCNPKKKAAGLKMERIRLPRPILKFCSTHGSDHISLDCFPLVDRKVVIADHTRRMFLCDADTRAVVSIPNLHKPKSRPISLFIPSTADANDHPSVGGGSLYVMERVPEPEKGDVKLSDQFEAFVCSNIFEGPWNCHLLRPPPFVSDRTCCFTYPKITSYAVVGSNICISHNSCNATYCLDTARNTWEVGNGNLPLYGKVVYVPELKLWFGFSTEARTMSPLAAADLSTMDSHSQPQLIGDWKEFDPPKGWLESHDPQLVNLGSGRFCIARFFRIVSMDDGEIIDRIEVFTGVEVLPVGHDGDGSGNTKLKLRMKKNKSLCHVSNGTVIADIF